MLTALREQGGTVTNPEPPKHRQHFLACPEDARSRELDDHDDRRVSGRKGGRKRGRPFGRAAICSGVNTLVPTVVDFASSVRGGIVMVTLNGI